jgi:hypothetical protein
MQRFYWLSLKTLIRLSNQTRGGTHTASLAAAGLPAQCSIRHMREEARETLHFHSSTRSTCQRDLLRVLPEEGTTVHSTSCTFVMTETLKPSGCPLVRPCSEWAIYTTSHCRRRRW